MRSNRVALAGALTVALVGCSKADKAASESATFPAAAAERSLAVSGWSASLRIDGTISGKPAIGTASLAVGSRQPAIFENQAGFASVLTFTETLTVGGDRRNAAISSLIYTNDAGVRVGLTSPTSYEVPVFSTSLPATVKVGDTGILSNFIAFKDWRKMQSTGHTVSSFIVEPGGNSSAVLDLISNRYDINDKLVLTSQQRFRITKSGERNFLSMEITYANGDVLNLHSGPMPVSVD